MQKGLTHDQKAVECTDVALLLLSFSACRRPQQSEALPQAGGEAKQEYLLRTSLDKEILDLTNSRQSSEAIFNASRSDGEAVARHSWRRFPQWRSSKTSRRHTKGSAN